MIFRHKMPGILIKSVITAGLLAGIIPAICFKHGFFSPELIPVPLGTGHLIVA